MPSAGGPIDRVMRNFLALGGSEIAARLISAGVTIYLARALGVESYGVLGVAIAIVLYLTAVVDWGFDEFAPREIAGDAKRLGELLPSLLVARLAVASFLSLGLLLIGMRLVPPPEGPLLAVYGLALLAAGMNTRWAYLGLERTGKIASSRLISEAVKAALILLLVKDSTDLLLVPVFQFLGELVGGMLLLASLRRLQLSARWLVRPGLTGRMYQQASPLLLTSLLGMTIYNADLVYLRAFRDAREVGWYLAAYALIGFFGILGNASRLSLVPTLARVAEWSADQQELYHTAIARLFALGLPLAIGGFLLAQSIVDLVYEAPYAPSAPVFAILIWSIPLLLLRGVHQSVLIARGHQGRVLRMTVIAAAFNLGVNFLAVPLFGMVGAAAVTLATEALRMTIGQLYVLEEGFSLTSFTRYWKVAIAAAGMAGMLALLPVSVWFAVPLGGLTYIALLTLTGGVRFRRGSLPLLQV